MRLNWGSGVTDTDTANDAAKQKGAEESEEDKSEYG
jgi:hypothetical protein